MTLRIIPHLSKIAWLVDQKALSCDLLFSVSAVIRKETSVSFKTSWLF